MPETKNKYKRLQKVKGKKNNLYIKTVKQDMERRRKAR
jgi:hypothetical protein